MFSRHTLKILLSSILTIATVILATHCQRLLPGKSDNTGSVSLIMDTSSLPSDLAAQMKSLRARVYKVESEALAGQDGVDQTFTLAGPGNQEFLLQGMTIGMREFVMEILNDQSEILGEGKLRGMVNPGVNKFTEKLRIQLKPQQERRRDLNVVVKFDTGSGTASTVTYANVSPILAKTGPHKCAKCHSSDPDENYGIDLTAFPFAPYGADKQKDAVNLIIARIEDNSMPPTGARPTAQDKETLKAWLAQGLLAAPTAGNPALAAVKKVMMSWEIGDKKGEEELKIDASGNAVGTLKNVAVGQKMSYKISAIGDGGAQLGLCESAQPWVIPTTDPLQDSIKLNLEAPTVSIPIEVVPAQ